MSSPRSPRPPKQKTSAEIAEMIGTGRVLDAAIRRAVRQAIEADGLRRKTKNPHALLPRTRRRSTSSQKRSR